VDGARDQLFARPALTRDEDAGLRGRDLLDVVEEPLHRRGVPDHLVLLALLTRDLGERAAGVGRLEGVLHAHEHPLARQRLLEEVGSAELDRLHGVVNRRVPADDEHRQIARRLVLLDALEDVEPAHVRQLHVEERGVHRRVGVREDRQALRAGLAREDVVALALEHELQRAADVLLVVDDEDGLGPGNSRGRRKRRRGRVRRRHAGDVTTRAPRVPRVRARPVTARRQTPRWCIQSR
jgi:hypothetical protein